MLGTMFKGIAMMTIAPLLFLLIPFVGVLMFIKIRRERHINKGIKKGIKSGVWLNEYKYTISPKFQRKIDKQALKQAKKQIKEENKRIKENKIDTIEETVKEIE